MQWRQFVDDFGDNKHLLNLFEAKPEWVDAWKKMDQLGADEVLRKNSGALDALAKKDAGEVVPDPSTYLSAGYIANHLAKFDGEVSTLSFENSINNYGQVGRNDGLFVLTKTEMDDLLTKTGGDIGLIEQELGIRPGTWSSRVNDPLKPDKLVRVDIKNSKNHNLRMATGNEEGANDLWIPGGKTPEGRLEAVIDPIPVSETDSYVKTVITQ